jgi:hypothetical protein
MMGSLGLIAGLWAEKFDQLAAFQNFIIMPMTFLSGVFYSVHSLPAVWQAVSHLNPFFYMIDGFRRGFFGVSDVSPWLSLAVVGGSLWWWRALRCGCCAAATSCGPEPRKTIDQRMSSPTPDQVREFIAAGLPCEKLVVEGDGRHFFATIVSTALKACRACAATSVCTPPWAIECASRFMPCR